MKPENLHKRPTPPSVTLVHRAAARRGHFAAALALLAWGIVAAGSRGPPGVLRNLSLENCKFISEKGTGFEQGLPLN